MADTRKIIDCRSLPGDKPRSITISGTEQEVLDLAALHASAVHGHKTPPTLRQQLRCRTKSQPPPQPILVMRLTAKAVHTFSAVDSEQDQELIL